MRRNWFIYIAYYLGFQDAEYAADYVQGNFAANEALTVLPYAANHIGRLTKGEISRLSRSRPEFEAVPTNADQRARQGCKVAQQMLEHFYDEHKLASRRYELAQWMATCGHSFYHLGWNPNAGDKHRAYKDPFNDSILSSQHLDDEDKRMLEAMHSYTEIREGDFDFEVLSPFQVRVAMGPSKHDDMPWQIVTRLRSLDWIWEHYPEAAPYMEHDENDWSVDAHYWRRLSTLVSHAGVDFAVRGQALSNGIEVHELWQPAYGRFPKGLHITFTNNHLLANEAHPLHAAGIEKCHYPFFPIRHTVVPGRYWGKGFVQDLLGPQEDYNKGRQQLIAQRDVMGKPQVITPRQAKLGLTRNVQGDIWTYSLGGGSPTIHNPPAMSQANVEGARSALYDLQMISAQSEATLGMNPAGVDSGIQLARLQEQDQGVLGEPVQELETGHHWLYSQFLKLSEKFIKVPRMVQVTGTAAQVDVMFYRGLDLQGQTNIRLVPGSMMPRSKAATQEALMRLLQLGAFDHPDPEVRRNILEAFEIGGLERMFFQLDAQRRRARIENEMFRNPDFENLEFGLPDVDDLDNHELHLEEHLNFQVGDDYEMMTPVMKQAFLAHVAKHQLAVAQMIQTQAMMGQLGGGGGPGGGSQPKEPGEPSPPRERQPTPGSADSAPAA